MQKYRVKSGEKFRLNNIDPDETSQFTGNKQEGVNQFEELALKLGALQELLYAEHKHKVLVVLQARDAGGKDGTIQSVLSRVNPQGVQVAGFKVPTPLELDHDYLWRIHQQTPGKGELVVFNRSHYEDVLVVRVHDIVPKEVWSKRYEQIRNFEKLLADEGTTILKFYLHISKDEQKQRFLDRINDPTKNWKFNPGDLKERALWDEYSSAYEDAISETSTDWAPWYVIPANRNWYRNLCVATVLVKALEDLQMKYPAPAEDLSKIVIE
ncbi:MAG TPA: polyphosphate kinase 2 family protein [Anaerolineales bacterium]|jgi:PPK2 family polyphosphate:nucleotide phosphotransferase